MSVTGDAEKLIAKADDKLTQSSAKDLINQLVSVIETHNYNYHVLDKPTISDLLFDKLMGALQKVERQFPDLVRQDSPSFRVGSAPLSSFTKAPHSQPMLSLSNAFSNEEISDFCDRVRKHLDYNEDKIIEYIAEPKIDGLAIEVIYKDGILSQALTRGDGVIGEDVTQNIRTIKSIPLKLRLQDPPKLAEIRGEVLLFKKDFENLNKQQEEDGEDPFANPRNAAAGSIRQLDSTITASRPLRAFFYGVGEMDGAAFETHKDLEDKIKSWGLPVNPLAKVCRTTHEVLKYYEDINKRRPNLEYDIDGVVIKVNSLRLQTDLGNIAKSPRWALAAKFQPDQAETIIEQIEVQVGRTGALTPVAIMRPTKVGGVTITHATLHNQDEIDRKDVRVGDHVIIQRAGDVIPEVVSVVLEKRKKGARRFLIPDKCPVCQSKAVREPDEAVTRCSNSFCEARIKGSLKHFASRRALNIEKLGDKIIDQLVDAGLVKSFSDLYKLTTQDFEKLPRQGEKSTANLLNSISASKNTTLAKFIFGLGIRFVGEETAKALQKHFGSVESFIKADEEELRNVDGVGKKVAESISSALKSKSFVSEVQKLMACGFTFQQSSAQSVEGSTKLQGQTFVITGTLDGMSRDEAKDFIEANGGAVSSSISKKTNYLLCGTDPGSKLTKAQDLGVAVISLEELKGLLTN